MKLGDNEVRKIAHLARIEISDQDVASYAHDLSSILDLVEQMSSVDTTDVLPMAHPQDTNLRFREDEVTETSKRDELLAVAPQTEAGLYLVPKVIE